MKRLLVAVLALILVPAGVDAQSVEATIERALAAAPARARDAATVVQFNADHTWETLKEGTNQIVCYDRSSDPGRPAFAVQCTSLGNLERVAQNRRFDAEYPDREARNAALAEAEANGTRVSPVYGSMWLTMNGQDMESARIHRTIAMPGATTASTGFPDNPRSGGAWIMAAGTTTAHLMVPGT